MTRLFNDPAEFADEMTDGFVLSSSRWVTQVSGGVIRSTVGDSPKVALVIGGGSGHYPAFAGLVGPGLADGAVMGAVFASPSVNQVVSVSRAASQGRGLLLGYGNYTGDVLHFEEARQRLIASGTDCRSVAVTDDIFSAPPDERSRRRGIAGDLAVFKVAGAAAEAGADLDEVERIARKANDRTRSMGVAFDGCTLPGAAGPLFALEPGRMAIGLGIHGEQGIGYAETPTADALAELFVDRLFAEIPDGVTVAGARVVPILNGLGGVKYEELYVVYRHVHRLLASRGIVVVDPQVGEFCTSLDMSGASLTLFWLDEELETLWLAPSDTPAFRRGGSFDLRRRPMVEVDSADDSLVLHEASVESRAAARATVAALESVRTAVDEAADELGRIDAIAGDGDHGIGMRRGTSAAAEAAARAAAAGAGLGLLLSRAGEAWCDRAGGTSGALWGLMLRTAGEAIGDDASPSDEVVVGAIAAGAAELMAFGKAEPGDKTMIDALVPFVSTLRERLDADGRAVAWGAAVAAARDAARATADLLPRKGRARSHGAGAIGTPDPGAISFAIVVEALAGHVAE